MLDFRYLVFICVPCVNYRRAIYPKFLTSTWLYWQLGRITLTNKIRELSSQQRKVATVSSSHTIQASVSGLLPSGRFTSSFRNTDTFLKEDVYLSPGTCNCMLIWLSPGICNCMLIWWSPGICNCMLIWWSPGICNCMLIWWLPGICNCMLIWWSPGICSCMLIWWSPGICTCMLIWWSPGICNGMLIWWSPGICNGMLIWWLPGICNCMLTETFHRVSGLHV